MIAFLVAVLLAAAAGPLWLARSAAGSAREQVAGRHKARFTAEEVQAVNRDLARAFKSLDDATDEVERRRRP